MNLLHLAPDLQEAVLHLPTVRARHNPITEHDLRPIAAQVEWAEQRCLWRRAYQTMAPPTSVAAAGRVSEDVPFGCRSQ